jgi:hypothetical protein
MPVFLLAVLLQGLGAVCLGIALSILLDHFRLIGGEEEGTSSEWLGAAAFLAASGVLFWLGTVLRRRRPGGGGLF